VQSVKVRSYSRAARRESRRQQIIEATIMSIDQVGFADTTLATVARIAGVAQGSLIFHFKTKDELLVAALRHMSDEYRNIWRAALEHVVDEPLTQLCVLVATEFQPNVCSRKKIGVWKAFWAEAKSRPLYQEICGERDNERHDVLRDCVARVLGAMTDSQRTNDIALAIDTQLDGLSENLLADQEPFSRFDAARIAFLTLTAFFPQREDQIWDHYLMHFQR